MFPLVMSISQHAKAFDLMQQTLVWAQDAEVEDIPKFHLFYHLADRTE